MPNNWKKYKLGDLADIQTGPFGSQLHQKDYVSEGTPLITVKNLGETRITHQNLDHVSQDDTIRLKKYLLKTGDIIFSRVGYIDRCSYVTEKENNWMFSGSCLRARINHKNAHSLFLSYYLNSREFLNYIENNSVGATRPSLNTKILSEAPITLPSLPEQQAIAEILSSLDDKIELNLQTNKTLEEMANALYKHWFVDFGPFKEGQFVESELGMIPEGWEVGVLGDIINFYNGYGFKSNDLLDEEIGDCYHVFKMGHIKKGGGLKSDGTRSFVQKSKCNKLENFILKKGDLLMSMTDMKDKVSILGHTAIMDEDDKYIVNQRVGLLRAKKEFGVDYPYLYLLSNSVSFLNDLRSRANSGVQVNLSTEGIKNTRVLIAPKNVHSDFNKIVELLFEKTFEIAKENETLKQTRDYLLPKLISGEIRVKKAVNSLKQLI